MHFDYDSNNFEASKQAAFSELKGTIRLNKKFGKLETKTT